MRRSLSSPVSLTILIGSLIAPLAHAKAETLQEIEGLSVKIDWKAEFDYFTPAGQPWTGGTDNRLQLYVSTKANIFQYVAAVMHPSGLLNRPIATKPQVFAFDRQEPGQNGQLTSWTMTGGHLTQTEQLVHGTTLTVIAIDPARLTCTFARQYRPDPATGTIVSAASGTPTQMQNYRVASYSCAVSRGNIFASTPE